MDAVPQAGRAVGDLADRVKDLTGALSKAVVSTARTVQRRIQPAEPSGEGDDEDAGGAAAEREEVMDSLGFVLSVTAGEAEARARCGEAQDRQRQKWAAAVPAGGALPPEDKLKRLCRKGVPPELRRRVWMEVGGANERRQQRHASYYPAMLRLGELESPFVHQIELDVPRTFPNCAWVQGEEGQEALRRVLVAFSRHKPDVGYCQGMNYIAALLLLALGRSEEDAFWMLAALIDDDTGILYQDMYARDLTGTHVEMRALRELVDSKLPRLGAHLDAMSCDMSILATDWFLCLFCTTLPPETALRVWDSLFLEGPKVLFRVALALLQLHEGALLAQDNPGELLRAARRRAAAQHDADALMRTAFERVGSMPMGTIRRHRAHKQAEVDSELAARETRAALRRACQEGGFVLDGDDAGLLREPHQEGPHSMPPSPEHPQGRGSRWRAQLQQTAAAAKEAAAAAVDRGKQRVLQHRKSKSMA